MLTMKMHICIRKCRFCLLAQNISIDFGKRDEEKEEVQYLLFLRLFFLSLLHNVPGWAVPFPPLFRITPLRLRRYT